MKIVRKVLVAIFGILVPVAVLGEIIVAEKTGAAIQRAIDEVAKSGGGRVVVPAGVYPSGSLRLRSGVELHLENEAEIRGETSCDRYCSFPREICSVCPEGSSKVFVYAWNEHNIAITGAGTINGRGVEFFDRTRFDKSGRFWAKPLCERPRMIQFVRCHGVRLEGVHFLNSPGWTMLVRQCEDVSFSRIDVRADRHIINSDGVDFDGCRKVRVSQSNFSTGDDCIVLRAMREDGSNEPVICEDVVVSDCDLESACQAVRIGCPSDDTIRNVRFSDMRIWGYNGIYFNNPRRYLANGDNGYLSAENLVFENFSGRLRNRAVQIDVDPEIRLRGIHDVTFRNFKVESARPLRFVGNVHSGLRDVRLENVEINGVREKDGPVAFLPEKGVLAELGGFVAPVVLPKESTPVVRHAAEEYCDHVFRMVWTKPEILVGENPDRGVFFVDRDEPGAGMDGFRIRREDGRLVISGRGRGLLYGVYEFLEKTCGVRWYAPDCTRIPQRRTVSVPEGYDVLRRPKVRLRDVVWAAAKDRDFLARCRLNSDYYGVLTEREGGSAFRSVRGMSAHTFSKLLPVETYGKTHPEYFAERDGRRVTVGKPQECLQACLSNPEVVRIMVRNAVEAFRRDPTADYMAVSHNDNLFRCTCSNCRAAEEAEGSPMGLELCLANAVAEALDAELPGKYVRTSAYQFTRKPPRITRPRENVFISVCSLECDLSHAISSAMQGPNADFRRDFEDWLQITRNLEVYDYATSFKMYTMPVPNVRVCGEDLAYFAGEEPFRIQTLGAYSGIGGDFEALKVWLSARVLWDPEADREALIDDFFTGYYGVAAPFVRRYFDALHGQNRTEKDACNCFIGPLSLRTCSNDVLDVGRQAMEKALSVAAGDPVLLRRVRLTAFPIDVTRFQRAYDAFANPPSSLRRRGLDSAEADEFRALARRIDEMLADFGELGISEYPARRLKLRQQVAEVLRAGPNEDAFNQL